MKKTYLTADQLLHDSFALAAQVIESGYRPSIIVGVWRGGSPIAIAVHEMFEACGFPCDNAAVRCQSYTGINQRERNIKIDGMQYLADNVSDQDRLLIVDDVHDSGLSMAALLEEIDRVAKPHTTKIATCYYKPAMSQTEFAPDFFLYETDQWLVFPHELAGLSAKELIENKPGIESVRQLLLSHIDKTNQAQDQND